MRRLRRSYGYDSYRGRSKLRTFLVVLIIVLTLALILAVAAFFLLQDHVYYSDDGTAHVSLPFLARESEAPSDPPEPTAAQPVVVVTQSPTPEPTAEPVLTPVALPASALTDGTAADRVKAAGGSAALFDMKPDNGALAYVSDLPQAISLGTSAAAPGLNDAIRALNDTQGLYTVARVSCFRDDLAPKMNNTLAIRTSIGNWRDSSRVRWLSPAVEASADYVAGICGELAELGFDEIWLDNAAYPLSGDLGFITRNERYDPAAFTSSLDAFYRKVETALAGTGVKLSLSADPEALTGGDSPSGQDPDLLGRYAYRLYLPGPEDETASRRYDAALEDLGLSPARLVCTTQPYTPETSSSYVPAGGRLLSAEK